MTCRGTCFGLAALLAAGVLATGCGGGGGDGDAGPDATGADPGGEVAGDAGADLPDDPGVADAPGDPGTADPGADGTGGDLPGDGTEADAADAPDVPFVPDAAFIHAVRDPPESAPIAQTPYLEDVADLFLDPVDTRSIAFIDGTLWMGTVDGLMRFDGGEEATAVADPLLDGVVVDVARHLWQGRVVVVFDDRVVAVDPAGVDAPFVAMAGTGLTGAATDGTDLWVGSHDGLWLPGGDDPVLVGPTEDLDIRDVAVAEGVVYMATSAGLAVAAGGIQILTAADGKLPDDDVRGLAVSGRTVIAATATGLSIGPLANEPSLWTPRKDGLPASDVTAVAGGLDDSGIDLMVGHARGATVINSAGSGRIPVEHYVSRRFLPDDAVRDVAIGADGARWIATAKGVARIVLREATLESKAETMFAFLNERFWRMDGFVASDAYVDDPDAPTTWFLPDFDNDGLWTQMAIGAFCQAYAVTGDERYYQAARKAMDVMFLLIDVPAADFEAAGLGRGFITRSLVRDDEGTVFDNKLNDPRWHRTTYGDHDYYWKNDTSSDETAGHFYGFPLFYDLCAKDDAERAAVAEHAGALAGYILDGGFTLRDLDGEPTSFGHWEPSRVAIAAYGFPTCVELGHSFEACAEAAFGGGWLNGLEILGHMLAAWHMTGERRFYDAYETLIRDHGYDRVVAFSDDILTVTNPQIANHSDHELAMLAYHTLIRYEPRDDRRQLWIDSLLGMYQWEIPERQPWWTALVALATPGQAQILDGLRTLMEIPADLRTWRVDNTHRKDATRRVNDRFDEPQWDTVFPYDEIRTMWWNGNPYRMVDGGDGRGIQSPTAFLLAYWTARYAGIVTDSKPAPR
ncbi:MAG TPA: hypothetical protein PK313_01280 [Myxococcota bacterium]|nr:hypothetical protein [Myxococcota bacterium]